MTINKTCYKSRLYVTKCFIMFRNKVIYLVQSVMVISVTSVTILRGGHPITNCQKISVVIFTPMTGYLLLPVLLCNQNCFFTFPYTNNQSKRTRQRFYNICIGQEFCHPVKQFQNALSVLFVQYRPSRSSFILKLRFVRFFFIHSIFLTSQAVSPTQRIRLVAFQINVVRRERRD